MKEKSTNTFNLFRENIKLAIPKHINLSQEDLDDKTIKELTKIFPNLYINKLE